MQASSAGQYVLPRWIWLVDPSVDRCWKSRKARQARPGTAETPSDNGRRQGSWLTGGGCGPMDRQPAKVLRRQRRVTATAHPFNPRGTSSKQSLAHTTPLVFPSTPSRLSPQTPLSLSLRVLFSSGLISNPRPPDSQSSSRCPVPVCGLH